MQYNPSPKTTFMQNANAVKRHHEFVENPDLRFGLESALSEFIRQLTRNVPPDMGGCASSYLRIQGAQEFLNLFYNLAETPDLPNVKPLINLPSNERPQSKK